MKRWISSIVVLLLAGCTAVPSIPSQPKVQGASIKASGGAFSATYSGTDGFNACQSMNGPGFFNFSGSGSGSFIHRSTEKGSMSPDNFCFWVGSDTLTNSLHPGNSITMRLTFASMNGVFGDPCHPRHGKLVQFVVSSGTGKFVNATGSGTVAFNCGNGRYSDQWSGTITF